MSEIPNYLEEIKNITMKLNKINHIYHFIDYFYNVTDEETNDPEFNTTARVIFRLQNQKLKELQALSEYLRHHLAKM